MKISNDLITIDASELVGLSDETRVSLTKFIGERLAIDQRFSDLLNGIILEAREAFPNVKPDISDVKDAIENLDPQTKAEVQLKLDQAQALIDEAATIAGLDT